MKRYLGLALLFAAILCFNPSGYAAEEDKSVRVMCLDKAIQMATVGTNETAVIKAAKLYEKYIHGQTGG